MDRGRRLLRRSDAPAVTILIDDGWSFAGFRLIGGIMTRQIITSGWWFGLISLSLCLVSPAAAQVDQQRAEAYFKEAATICQRDGGRLWGVSLCGPMVFADARTRTLATNQPRRTGELRRTPGFATFVASCS